MCSATWRAAARSGEPPRCRPRTSAGAARAREVARRDRRHERRVEPAGEEDADGDVAHHLALDARSSVSRVPAQQRLAVGDRLERLGHRGGEAREPLLGRPRAAGRERLDERPASRGRRRASRRRSGPRRSLRPVERLDADRVAGGDEAPVPAGITNANMPFSSASAARPRSSIRCSATSLSERGQQRGRRAPPDLLVVVDLAVADQPHAVARAQRLLPPPTSTIESRRCPSQLPSTSTAPRSSGPRCASRSSIRSSASGSEAPCSATIPHMCSLRPTRRQCEPRAERPRRPAR